MASAPLILIYSIGKFLSYVRILGLVQDSSISISNAMERVQSCTKPSNCGKFKLYFSYIQIKIWNISVKHCIFEYEIRLQSVGR